MKICKEVQDLMHNLKVLGAGELEVGNVELSAELQLKADWVLVAEHLNGE